MTDHAHLNENGLRPDINTEEYSRADQNGRPTVGSRFSKQWKAKPRFSLLMMLGAFFLGSVLTFFGIIIYSVSKPSDSPSETPAPAAALPETPPAVVEQQEPPAAATEQTLSAPKPEDATSKNTVAKTSSVPGIYQDENGVWRNSPPDDGFYQDQDGTWRNRVPEASSAQSNKNGASSQPPDPAGDLINNLLKAFGNPSSSTTNGTGPYNLSGLTGLMGGESGDLSGLGDLIGGLSGMMGGEQGDLSGLGSLVGGMSGMLGGDGDLNSLLESMSGLAGSHGAIDSLLNPSGPSLTQGSAPRPNTIKNPAIQRPGNTPGKADPNLNRVTDISSYEQFDPNTANQLKSDWEYFQDPR